MRRLVSLSFLAFAFLAITIAAQQPSNRYKGHFSVKGGLSAMTIDAKAKYTIFTSDLGDICVISMESKSISLKPYPAHKKAVVGADFLAESKQFVTAGVDGSLKFWQTSAARKHHIDVSDPEKANFAEVPKPTLSINPHSGGAISAMAVSRDGTTIATASNEGFIKLWTAEGKAAGAIDSAHRGAVKALAFSPDGKRLASGGIDKTLKVWSLDDKPKLVKAMADHEGAVTSVAWDPAGKRVATGSGAAKKPGTVRVWEAETGKLLAKLDGHTETVTCVKFHPKTEHLASGGADTLVRVWDLTAKKEVYKENHPEALRGLTLTEDAAYFGTFTMSYAFWWSGFGT
jgi:WD40 repeat protein